MLPHHYCSWNSGFSCLSFTLGYCVFIKIMKSYYCQVLEKGMYSILLGSISLSYAAITYASITDAIFCWSYYCQCGLILALCLCFRYQFQIMNGFSVLRILFARLELEEAVQHRRCFEISLFYSAWRAQWLACFSFFFSFPLKVFSLTRGVKGFWIHMGSRQSVCIKILTHRCLGKLKILQAVQQLFRGIGSKSELRMMSSALYNFMHREVCISRGFVLWLNYPNILKIFLHQFWNL